MPEGNFIDEVKENPLAKINVNAKLFCRADVNPFDRLLEMMMQRLTTSSPTTFWNGNLFLR